jgi:hypothetical protein
MIVFAILAHDREDVLMNQIKNIRHYNPNSSIVLYNGGTNSEFASSLGIPICPYSRPLSYGKLGRYLLDVMRWLESMNVKYDYLVSTDSDVLFVNGGYESFLKSHLEEHDFAGVDMHVERTPHDFPDWITGQTLWKEWGRWQPFFRTNGFCGTFNPMQVYTRKIVEKMVASVDLQHLERLLNDTEVYALEEMLHATIALRCGGKPRKYPQKMAAYTRYGRPLTLEDVQEAKQTKSVYFVHPISREMNDPARQWITDGN